MFDRFLCKILSSDGVEEANNVGVIRNELMPWSNGLETEKEEIPDHVLVVMVQSVETSNDMSHLQLLLCIFQQGDEGPLGAFGQLVGGHTDVQPVLPKHGFPVGTGAPQTCSRKSDLCGLVLPSPNWCWLGNCIFVFIGVLSIDLKVRGISWIPRASALWELPTCAGDIKPAAEARRRNN